ELVGFLMGGIESPAGIFVALIHELVRAPGVRDRVIAEVDEVVGDGPVAAEHATALPYLRNTLLETMRLWSAWINMLTADGPVSLGDVEVPSGAMVGFSVNMIHHDPRNYTDPERFLPSRWEQPDVELIDPDAVAPFGVGVRKCPADHFSWSELTLQAAALLRDRLPVLPESHRGVPVGVTTKGVGVRPASARVVLYPRRRAPRAGAGPQPSRPARSTTLDSRNARVSGPTPPGFGEAAPATPHTSGCTSPASAPSTRDTPTSSTAAPGLTMPAVSMWGTPAAATITSARRVSAERSRVPVWHRVTVEFSLRRVSMSPMGRPTVTPRPTTTTCAPANSTSNRRSRWRQPLGVHGSGAGSFSTNFPRLTGWSPSASLAGSIRSRTAFSSR